MSDDDALFARALLNLGDMVKSDITVRCSHRYANGRRCPFSKKLGNAPVTGDTLAASHALRHRGHRVVVSDNGIPVRDVEFAQPELTDAPPF